MASFKVTTFEVSARGSPTVAAAGGGAAKSKVPRSQRFQPPKMVNIGILRKMASRIQ
jgi:hypothetical protein